MNITIISTSLPYPLNSGGAQAQYNFIDTLRSEHSISFVFPEKSRHSRKYLAELRRMWPDVKIYPYSLGRQMTCPDFVRDKTVRAAKLLLCHGSRSFLVERTLKPYGYYLDKGFIGFVSQVIDAEKTDILQVDFYPYLDIINHVKGDFKTVFIHHEIRYVRNLRLLSNVELTQRERELLERLKEEEIANLNKFDTVVTLTDTDKRELLSAGVTSDIRVSPAAINATPLPYKGYGGELVFIGGASHTPNKEGLDWFFANVYSNLDKRLIKSINIIGNGWGSGSFKQGDIRVNVCGFVDKLESVAYGCINIVPILSGSGMRMKIVEAAAMGLPTVTTTVGVEGLAFANEHSCLIADTPADFAKAVNRLAADEALRLSLTSNAREIFDTSYSKECLCERRNNVYKAALGAGGETREDVKNHK